MEIVEAAIVALNAHVAGVFVGQKNYKAGGLFQAIALALWAYFATH